MSDKLIDYIPLEHIRAKSHTCKLCGKVSYSSTYCSESCKERFEQLYKKHNIKHKSINLKYIKRNRNCKHCYQPVFISDYMYCCRSCYIMDSCNRKSQ